MILEDIWVREVAMNPAAYADSMTQAAERGVLVGFEFEVMVPYQALNSLRRLNKSSKKPTDDDEDDLYGYDDYGEAAQGMAKMLANSVVQGQSIKIFQDYHEKRKALDTWYIEPDGSIDEPFGGTAMEIVSPPLPAAQAIPTLRGFVALARKLGLETNDSTGLHINVSIPDDLDILKLIVFSGDEYVLRQFQREESDYAEAVMRELESFSRMPVSNQRKTDRRLIKYLEQMARMVTDSHSASISRNRKYISFRHAGDDYLNNLTSTVDVVGRFVRAMVIAATPGAYREEYLKKLAALIEPGRRRRRADAGQAVTEPSSPALNWVRRNGWPAVTVFGRDRGFAWSMIGDVAPDFRKLGYTATIVQIPPTSQDGVLPRDLKKWAVLPNDLQGVDIIVRAEPRIRAERLTGLTTVPVTKGEGRRLYQQALRLAQRQVGRR